MNSIDFKEHLKRFKNISNTTGVTFYLLGGSVASQITGTKFSDFDLFF